MTQKRFRKLMMALGFSRNAANYIIYQNSMYSRWSYYNLYNKYRFEHFMNS